MNALRPNHIVRWLVSIGILFLLLAPHSAAKTENQAISGGEHRVPLASEPITLDPAKFSGIYAMNVGNNLFDGLVEFDGNLNVVPAIAKIWKISRDHRIYTFMLRDDVSFHNGRRVTAEDFVFSFKRILDPQVKSPAASLFANIKGAKDYHDGVSDSVDGLRTMGRHTLVIELEKPFAPFLSILAMANAKVLPKESLGKGFDTHPVGTGPFRFESWVPGKEIVLAANKSYFKDGPHLDRLRFVIYKNVDWDRIYADFEAGRLDQSLVASGEFESVDGGKADGASPTLISKPGLNVVYIGMNLDLEAFKDRRVRQAVYHAVDREKIVKESTRWRSLPAKGILPPGIAGFDPYFKGYDYDPDKARKLLAEAGYANGRGIPAIELWTVSKTDRVKNQLQQYRQYLADIGIRVTVKVAENWKDFVARINSKQAAMFYAAWYADFPDPDNFLFTLCHSKSRTNRMNYNNAKIDRMLEAARSEVDYMKRVEQYREIQELVMQDAPVIAQHVNSFNYVFQPWVKGIHMNHLGSTYLPFRKIWIDSRQSQEQLAAK